MELRYYQKEAQEAVLGEWAKGQRKTLASLSTGTGKTVIFASILNHQVQQAGRRGLILAHREELLTQAADKLEKVTGLKAAMEKAKNTSLGAPERITVGSVQSFAQPMRLERFPRDYFTDIVIDEAHHALSPTYQRVLAHFPEANILGVSATPDRGDKRRLGEYFDSMAYEYDLRTAIRDGFLVPIVAQMIPLQVDLSEVGMTNGDFAAGDLGTALDPYLEQIAKEMKHYCQGRKTMVFLPLVTTSRKFCRILNEAGISACEVNGNSPDRKQILKDFAEGRYQVLCNAMLLTEGFDQPDVSCIICLRPTKIRSLYTQMVGRGTRLAPGKENLLLLDFRFHANRHDLCHPSTLVSRNETIGQKMNERLAKDDGIHDLMETEEGAIRDVMAERERALAEELAMQRRRKSKLVDPLQYILSIEDEALSSYVPTFAWEMGPASGKQLAYLEKLGISPESVANMGMASMLIERLTQRYYAGLATPKQIRVLENQGFRHVGNWSKKEAGDMIGQLLRNNWRIPYGVNPNTFTPHPPASGILKGHEK